MYQYDIVSGRSSLIKNKGPWGETDMSFSGQVLSHDGKRIIYDSFTKDWISQVVIRNLDGSEVRTIYSEKDYYSIPYDLSPDEKFILALRSKNETINNLTLISTTDGSVRELRYIPSSFFMFENAKFSPDGQFIAFSFVRDGNPPHGDIFLMSSDGQNEIVVAGHPAEDRLLGWTANGKNLLFLSDRSGTWDVWTVSITKGRQQGEPELLKKDFGYYSEVLGISPAGSFYYKVNTPSGGLYGGALDLEAGNILVPPSRIKTRYIGPPMNLTWSSDGKSLLYLSNRGSIGPGNNLITIQSNATGEERILKPYLRAVNQLSWAPDGQYILAFGFSFSEQANENSKIWRIFAQGGTPLKLDISVPNMLIFALHPDNRHFVYSVAGETKSELWVLENFLPK